MGRFLGVFVLFLILHVVPALPPVRLRLRATFGERGYLSAYSVLSLVLFAALIAETLRAPFVPLWFAGSWAHAVALLLVPLALALLGASLPAANPLSIALVTGPFDPARPGAVAITRHPILWGLALWALAHLPANGDLVGLILFGGLGSFALVGTIVIEHRRRESLGEMRWQFLASDTSWLPFEAILFRRAPFPTDYKSWVGGGVGLAGAVLLLAGGHAWLFGRDPLAGF